MSIERRPAAARVADVRNRRAREIQRAAAAVQYDFDDVRIGELGGVVNAPANGATSSLMAPGSMSGSSPCTLTTTSQSSDAATSAMRSVPVSCVAFVSRTLPPNVCACRAMRRSSVATITFDKPAAAARR